MVAPWVKTAKDNGVPFYIGEGNSVSHGGAVRTLPAAWEAWSRNTTLIFVK